MPFSLKTLAEKNYAWKGEKASYHKKHEWIRKHYGKASMCYFEPTHVGKFEWAFIGKRKGTLYCTRNIMHYIQLCQVCHRKLDKNGDFCKNGHFFSPENTYTFFAPSIGRTQRRCRECYKSKYVPQHQKDYRKLWVKRNKEKLAKRRKELYQLNIESKRRYARERHNKKQMALGRIVIQRKYKDF